jgi:CRISPR-associated protein (TIGR03986 family)
MHKNPKQPDRIALAPYNFVSLPPGGPRIAEKPLSHDRYYLQSDDPAAYSGWFECTLTTETPCFIRGPVPLEDYMGGKDAKDKPEFFSLDGQAPRIPGSSLRGLFRTLIEIGANARIGAITDQRLVFRAVDTTRLGELYRKRIMHEDQKNWFTPNVQAGYIRKWSDGEWYIQPATRVNGTTWCRISHKSLRDIKQALEPWHSDKLKSVRKIYVQPSAWDYQEVRGGFLRIRYARALRASAKPAPGLQEAVLVESGKIMTKRSEAVIFAPDKSKDSPDKGWLPLRYKTDRDGNLVELDKDYINQLTEAQKLLLGPPGVLQDWHPVFYLTDKDEKLIFFGHTLMMRLPYKYTILDKVPANFRTQGNPDIDLAEALFGYSRSADNKTNIAFASRVSFSDGIYRGNLADPFEREIKPKVLSTPKPTSFQLYLTQPNPDEKENLLNYDDENAWIRGRKLYWHKGAVSIDEVEERDKEKLKHVTQYTRIRAVKPAAEFKFLVRFDNLRPAELGALAWVLQLAADQRYRLKLGMGKPYGMGAIKITSTLYLVDRKERYLRPFAETNDGWHLAEHSSPNLDELIGEFKKWVAGGTEQFDSQHHIQELLAMLSWPGPPRDKTRYLEIERRDREGRKTNEYRTRPVLPTPSAVLGIALPAVAPASGALTPATAPAPSTPTAQLVEWHKGTLIEIRPDRHYGVVRDQQTNETYRFDTRVIQGNTPATKSQVLYQLQDGRVIAVKRA